VFAEYFAAGGPVMYAVLAVWVVVFAGVLDRVLYALGRVVRRPSRSIRALVRDGDVAAARARFEAEERAAERGLERIDAVSQIATSLGLFGTVLGIARAFFARGPELGLAAPDALAGGLATALFTTIAGLIVFLFGQAFLIAFAEWRALCDRDVAGLVAGEARR